MKIVLTMAFLGIAWASYGQFEEDYDRFSTEEILECIVWLQETPMEEAHDSRKTVNAFLLQWVSRNPAVRLELHRDIVDLAERNPDLMAIYISGWAEYALTIQNDFPSVDAHIKGMEAVINFYKKNMASLNRDRYVEKLIKLEKKGGMYKRLRKDWG